MNNSIKNFIELFTTASISTERETVEELTYKIFCDKLKVPNYDDFKSNLLFLNDRDKLTLSIVIGQSDPLDYYSNNDPKSFLSDLAKEVDLLNETEEIHIQVDILKSISKGVISLYSVNSLVEYLRNLSIKQLLYVLYKPFSVNKSIVIESQQDNIYLKTASFLFNSKGSTESFESIVVSRDGIIGLAKTVSHFNLLNEYDFIPNDFYVLESNNAPLTDLFNKICTILSAAFIFDIFTVEDQLDYKLNGYKSIKGTQPFSTIEPEQSEEYFKTYNWCYTGGNFIDKIGLSRNIISLHLQDVNDFKVVGNPFQSIQSSFKVYEKENIKQYIEIRNKVSEQLLSFHDRANKIIETFASGFQKSALVLVSFYISTIVIKILNRNDLTGVFTFDAALLTTAFVACGFMYFDVSRWEVLEQKKRFEQNYNNLKERYSDLLDKKDIERILNKDTEFQADLSFIDIKLKKYTMLWVVFLGIIFITPWYLFLVYQSY